MLSKTMFQAIVLMTFVLAAALGQTGEFRSIEDTGLTSHELATIVGLAQLDASIAVFERHFGPLGRYVPEEWMEVGDLSNLIDPEFADSLITHDDWGRPLLMRLVDDHVLIVSTGVDGVGTSVDIVEELIDRRANVPSQRELGVSVGDDLLFAEGELIAGPRSTVVKTKTTMADMRTIATASEAFAVDWGHYPVLPRGVVPGSALRDLISPVYIKRMPAMDGWGNPFVLKYEARGYLIVSHGADGMPQFDYEEYPLDTSSGIPNTYSDPADDIVYSNGSFVSYPVEMFRR